MVQLGALEIFKSSLDVHDTTIVPSEKNQRCTFVILLSEHNEGKDCFGCSAYPKEQVSLKRLLSDSP